MTKNLINLIKGEKLAAADREGQTPLLIFAIKVKNEFNEQLANQLKDQIAQINFNELSIDEVSSFILFLQYSQLKQEEVYQSIIKQLKIGLKNKEKDTILKRGLLLRFIAENCPDKLSLISLLKEDQVRAQSPWIWIDCVSLYNWDFASNEISQTIAIDDDIKNLLVRLPKYIKDISKEKLKNSCVQWFSNLKNRKERDLLIKWTSNLEIKFGLSIAAEERFNRISYFQKPLLS